MIEVGESAPDFTLTGVHEGALGEWTLSEVAATRPVALVFYVYNFSPICTSQMCEVRDLEWLTFTDEAAVLGISTDGPYSHRRFAAEYDLSFPLLSDRTMTVYDSYGMTADTETGRDPRRGVVLVDSDGTVRYVWQAADTWADWEVGRLAELNDRLTELLA
ncbi:MAG: redoxin domain-containing protein [Halobaculum sp.]